MRSQRWPRIGWLINQFVLLKVKNTKKGRKYRNRPPSKLVAWSREGGGATKPLACVPDGAN